MPPMFFFLKKAGSARSDFQKAAIRKNRRLRRAKGGASRRLTAFGGQNFPKAGASRRWSRLRRPIFFKRRRFAPIWPPSAAKHFQKPALRADLTVCGGQTSPKAGASRRKTPRAARAKKKSIGKVSAWDITRILTPVGSHYDQTDEIWVWGVPGLKSPYTKMKCCSSLSTWVGFHYIVWSYDHSRHRIGLFEKNHICISSVTTDFWPKMSIFCSETSRYWRDANMIFQIIQIDV